jgi:hypothetical protein
MQTRTQTRKWRLLCLLFMWLGEMPTDTNGQ